MLTGYWPPTNEMLRQFSTNPDQNTPYGWQGQNWEGRGYNIYAFFPEFPGGTGSNPKGNGDFEVDYQDVSSDFWRLTDQVHPVAIMSFGEGAGPWEIEYNARNLPSTTWSNDYLSPTKPTPVPPDSTQDPGYVRHSSLPMEAIADAINSSGLGINAWVDWDTNPGNFLCEYMAYHDGWYQSLHSDPNDSNDPYYCAAAGFTHLDVSISSSAVEGVEVALRALINHLDSQLLQYTISGTVTSGGSPLAGVTMCGLPGNPVTNASGAYTAQVGGGWSGTVTPLKSGYAFTSSQRTYSNVRANQSAQDYTASAATADTILFDAASSNYGSSVSATLSWSHTVASGNNRILVVGAVCEDATAADQIISSVKYNGVNMTPVPGATKSRGDSSSAIRADLYYMLNPPTGTNIVLITYNGSVSYRVGGAISLQNVKQQAPEAVAANSATAAAISTPVTVPNSGAWIVDVVGHSNSSSFTTSTSTERWDRNSGYHTGAGATKAVTTPGSNTITWTYSGSSGAIVHSLAVFAPSDTTAPTPPGQASSPVPATGATNVGVTQDLSWTAGSNATSHDVYFGTSSPGTFRGNQTGTTFDTGTMSNNTTYYWRIDEKNAGGTTTGTVWSFTTIVAPPAQASSPNPANLATGVSTAADLSWSAGSGATSHDVYFGTSSPGTFRGNQAGTTFDPGTLSNNTTYYWRIDEKNAGGTTTGTVWSFTTIVAAPGQASTPNPANSATNVSKNADLSWTAGAGATSHDVYFGTSSPGTFRGNQAGTTFDPGTMANGTIYYWRIDEKNAGGTTTGAVWSFTTIPARTLTSSSGNGGNVTTPGEGAYNYDHGTVVNIVAAADTNYHFVNWTGTGVTAGKVASPTSASTTITMDGDYTVVANFAIDTFTLSYSAGAGGSLTGTTSQVVDYGSNGTAVTAVPNTGYHFVNWSDSSTTNPRTDLNVTANITVTANFAIDTHTVTFIGGANGNITGTLVQVVNHGSNCTPVTAVANPNYHFTGWTGSFTGSNNPLTIQNVTADMTITANFAIDTFTLSYSAGTGGSLTGIASQVVDYGTNGTAVTAVPNTGYHFVNWSDSSTANPRTDLNVTANITVTVNFTIDTFTLSYSAGANGSIIGTSPQTVDYGTSGTAVTAQPATGYHFVKWSDDSTANPRTDTDVTANINVTATFAINTYTVTFIADPGGSITGISPQTVNYGADCSPVSAVPNSCYHFAGWSGGPVGTDNPLTITGVTEDMIITANFAINTDTLSYTAGTGGTISGATPQTVDCGNSGTAVTAVPNTGYHFVKWSDDSTANPRTDTNVTTNITVTAQFAIDTFTLTYTAGATGSIIGTSPQTVDYGANGTAVTAQPNTGYHFTQWSDSSTANPRTDTNVSSNISVTAAFDINTYTVTFIAGPGGTLSGTLVQLVSHGSYCTPVIPVPDNCYQFTGWTGNYPGTDPFSEPVTQDMTITANFAINTYTLNYTAGSGGMISGTTPQTADCGANGSAVTAVSNTGYHFVKWSDNSFDNPRTDLNVTANISVTAQFAIDTFTLTYAAGSNGYLEGTFPQTVNYGESGSAVLAVPNTGYHFVKWSDDRTDNPRTDVNATHNISVTALFAINTYTLTYTAGVGGTITGTSPQTVDYGDDGTAVTAVPNTGHHFVKWSDDVTANPRTDLNVTANITVTAQFAIDTFTLSYTAGANGTITGTSPQTVDYGANGTAVTAIPNTGYHFVKWSDGRTDNPRTDVNVTANISVTATFSCNCITATYTAGANGTVTGTSPQTVDYGGSTSPVVAVPNIGYHFVKWSDDSTANPRTDTNVTADITVTAQFAIDTFTLTYTPGTGGTISGASPQTVNYGANGTTVTAVPNPNYHFVIWSDVSTENPRTDHNVTANISVTANFAINTYTLTYTAGANGTLTGQTSQVVNYGANSTAVTAVPNPNYHFVNWSDLSTANPRTDLNVTGNISVTANFAIDTHTVTFIAGANGSITGTLVQVVNHGSNCTLVTAAANPNYHFNGWTGSYTGSNNPLTIQNVTADMTVTANFAIDRKTLISSSSSNGTVTTPGIGTFNYDYGTAASIVATPNTNYHFVNWTGTGVTAGKVASPTSASTTITMDGNYTVVANFAIDQKTLTVSKLGSGIVTIPGTGTFYYNYGTTPSIVATPNTNYHFVNWTGTGVTAGKVNDPNSASTTITMDDNYTVVANFAKDQKTLTSSSSGNGTVTTPGIGTFNYDYGTVASITASPNENCHFVNWTGTGVTAGKVNNPNSASTSIAMDGNYTVVANFAVNQCTITASAGVHGSISPSGTFSRDYGSSQLFTAAPSMDYQVDKWTVDSVEVQTGDTTYTLSNITANHVVNVTFKIKTFTLTYNAGANGTISGVSPQTVDYGGNGTAVTALPATGYHFVKWSDDSTATLRTDTNVTADIAVTAQFAINTFTLTYAAGANGTITGTSPQTVDYGANGTAVTAIPNTGYHFVNWSDGSTDNPRSDLNVTANISVTAHFECCGPVVTFVQGANGLISGTLVQYLIPGDDCSPVWAVPNYPYHFTGWTGDYVGMDNPLTITNVTENMTITANFAIDQYTISGYCIEPDGNTAVEGVLVQTDGDVNAVTDVNGFYTLQVAYGWTGIITPQKEGYILEPSADEYTNVTQNYTDANYITSLMTFKIAGYVLEQDLVTPISDVNVTAENGGGSWTSRYGPAAGVTDANGYYEVTVDYNWSGSMTPAKYAYAFEPNHIQYANVLADQNDRDYIGEPMTFAISGYIRNDCSTPIQGITVSADNGGGQIITDVNGFYEVWVPYNWSGTVTPGNKTYYTFTPVNMTYGDVLGSQSNRNYLAENIYDLDCDGSIGYGDFGVLAGNWLNSTAGNNCDFNDDTNVNFIDYAELANLWLMEYGK